MQKNFVWKLWYNIESNILEMLRAYKNGNINVILEHNTEVTGIIHEVTTQQCENWKLYQSNILI